MAVYVDTSAWIALHEPRDNFHKSARDRLNAYIQDHEILVAGWHTMIEFADGLVRHYGQRVAEGEMRRILGSPRLHVEPSEPHLPAALELFQRNRDWAVDLSDCLSFAVMKDRGMTRAFTYDADFKKAGLSVEG